MPTLLILNPNTSPGVTSLLQQAAAAAGEPAGWAVRAATARFGPRYITGEIGAAVAGHAALDALAAEVATQGWPDVVLLACFGDPGLFALRAASRVPVLGMAEAAMRAAAAHGPFAVITGGAAWVPMLERLAAALALPAPLLGVHAVDRSGGQLAADPAAAVPLLADAAAQALQRWPQARVLLLGGAGLAGFAAPVAAQLHARHPAHASVPVLCNVRCALQAVPALLGTRPAPAAEAGPWLGLSDDLHHLLAAPPLPPHA